MGLRVTENIHFDTGIRQTDYVAKPAGQSAERLNTELLPGDTTVTESLKALFPNTGTIQADILQQILAANAMPQFRTSVAFQKALRNALKKLKEKRTPKGADAAKIVEELLEDNELLDKYRASLLES